MSKRWLPPMRFSLKHLLLLLAVVAVIANDVRSHYRATKRPRTGMFAIVPVADLDEAEVAIKRAFPSSGEYRELTGRELERHVSVLSPHRADPTSGRLIVFQHRSEGGEKAFVDIWAYAERYPKRIVMIQCEIWSDVRVANWAKGTLGEQQWEIQRLSERVGRAFRSAGFQVLPW